MRVGYASGMDLLGNVPWHPLVVHLIVILGPLTALGLIVSALVRRWRPALRWPLAAIAFVSGLSAVAVNGSGERLLERLFPDWRSVSEASSGLAVQHAQVGSVAALVAVLVSAWTIGYVLALPWLMKRLATRSRDRVIVLKHVLSAVADVLSVLLGIVMIVAIIIAGHLGAAATWTPIVGQ